MPTREYIRFWCSKCQEFTIQHKGKEGACTICGTITKEYRISEVPKEKIEEQRKRYNASRLKKYGDYVKMFGRNNMLESIFREPGEIGYTDIIEDDAGQREIDQTRFNERSKQAEKRKEAQKEYELHFKHTGRNDKCPCGSGNKYKKCCYDKYRFFV